MVVEVLTDLVGLFACNFHTSGQSQHDVVIELAHAILEVAGIDTAPAEAHQMLAIQAVDNFLLSLSQTVCVQF